MPREETSLLRTAALCAALCVGAYASADALTHGFQTWTAEGARRLEVALHPVPAPAVTVEGPGIGSAALPRLLAGPARASVVEFFYTRCETVCLALGATFQQMQAALQEEGAPARVQLLSISIDPRRDTPEALRAHAKRMRADGTRWQFVRVPDAVHMQRLLAAWQVVVVPDGRGDYEHNAALLVVDGAGRLVRVFDIAEHELALAYARHLAAGGAS